MTIVDLLIRLRQQDNDTYTIEMQRRDPGSIPVEPLAQIRPRPTLTVDRTQALAVAGDSAACGRWLGELLFDRKECYAALREALTAAGSTGTVRLRLDLDDGLQWLAWETMALPDLGTLSTGQRILFSRYLESDRGYVLQPAGSPRAVAAIADPVDINKYGLARPEVSRYREAASENLRDHALEFAPATASELRRALQRPQDVLYLVAHGGLNRKNEPSLFFENEAGHTARVDGATFANDILNHAAPPRLVVLVSCHSSGSGSAGPDQDALAALGPLLIRAGVPAVIAMRGEVTMSTAEAFLPVLFRELASDGRIDRAVAAARREVKDRPDAWAPVLFLRLPDGRLYAGADEEGEAVPFHAEPPPTYFVDRPLLTHLRRRLQEPGPGRPAVSALIGMGGSGKSTLAQAVAHDPTIRTHFRDGVLWVTLGREAELLPALVDRLQTLGDHEFRATTVEAASQRLGDLLREKTLLLVVDDAWYAEDVEPFVAGGSGCHVLITTRRREVADETGATAFNLGIMERTQSLTLLSALLDRPLAEEERQKAAAVSDAVGHLPLALELVAARVRRGAAWSTLLGDLQEEVARLEALEPSRRRRRKGELRLEASLNGSLTWLREEDPEAWEAFLALGVVPEDTAIAAPAAATLWDGVAVDEAAELLAILQEEALLTRAGSSMVSNQTWPAYTLHDMLRAVARRRLAAKPPDGLGLAPAEAHAALLDRYRSRYGSWHQMPDDGYIHRHLLTHLRGAERAEEIHALLWTDDGNDGNSWYGERERLGQPAGYVADVTTAWRLAEAAPPDYTRQIRYALIITTLNSLAANVPVPLLIRLLSAGIWSPAYTLAYVRQIADPATRAGALAAIAMDLPEPLRSHARADAAETIPQLPGDRFVQGLTNVMPVLPQTALPAVLDTVAQREDARIRAGALIALLPALSDAHQEQAVSLARAIAIRWDRARALAALGQAWRRPPLLEEAIAAADEISRALDRAGAFSDVLGYLPPARWAAVLEKVGAYDQVGDRYWVWAEARLLPYRPESEQAERVKELQERAEPLVFDHLRFWPAQKAVKPLLEITPFLPDAERERLWRMVFERIDSDDEKRTLLARHARRLPRKLVIQESNQLLEWAIGAGARAFVDSVAPLLPLDKADPDALTDQVDDILDPERLYPLALLVTHLPNGLGREPARAILRRIRSAYDVDFRVRMVAALAPALEDADLPDALDAVRQVGDPTERYAAEKTLAAWTTADGPPPEADTRAIEAESVLADVEAEPDEESAARLLADSIVVTQFRPDQREMIAGLLEAALAGGHFSTAVAATQFVDDENTRTQWVITLAAHFPADSLLDLYAKTWDEEWAGGSAWYGAQVRAGITPAVVNALVADPSSGNRLLPVLREAAERGELTGLPDDPAAHLPALLVNAGVRATQDIFDVEMKARALARLAPYLPPDQRHGLYRRALDVVWERQQSRGALKTGSKWDTIDESRPIAADFADPLLGIGPLLPEEMVGEALNRIDGVVGETVQAQLLIALAPYLTGSHVGLALEKSGRLATSHNRAGALIALAPHLPPDQLETALATARELQPPILRLRTLLTLLRRAAAVAPEQLPGAWPEALHLASRGTRPEFLAHLGELTPALHALGGREAVDATRQAVGDVGRWWP